MMITILIVVLIIIFIAKREMVVANHKLNNDKLNNDENLRSDIFECINNQLFLENKKLLAFEVISGKKDISMLATVITMDIYANNKNLEVFEIHNSDFLIRDDRKKMEDSLETMEKVQNYGYMPLSPEAWKGMLNADKYIYFFLKKSYDEERKKVSSSMELDAYLQNLFSTTNYEESIDNIFKSTLKVK